MKQFAFKKIDAFATANSSGNPAGYIWLDSKNDITEQQMQHIAKELKGFVNEVGYIFQLCDDEFVLRFYSSEREVDFCGHATIAIMYDLIKNNAQLQEKPMIYIHTNRGKLCVDNRIATENAVFIMSPVPVEKQPVPSLQLIAQNLKIDESEIDHSLPVRIINAGLSTLLVPIKSLDAILSIAPELEQLKNFCIQSGIDIIEVFTNETTSHESTYRTRVFAPTFGYLEDPATGSGNSAFGYYLLTHNRWQTSTIRIEQNGLRQNYNIVKLQRQIDDNAIERVWFGGAAITRIEGRYIVQ